MLGMGVGVGVGIGAGNEYMNSEWEIGSLVPQIPSYYN